MSASQPSVINRLRAGFFSPEKRFETVIYFNGPLSKWKRSPDDREIISRREFRFEAFAKAFGMAITRRLVNVLFEVRKL